MDKYELKWTRLQLRILKFLYIKSGESFSLRKIARNLNVSPTAISNSIKTLEKEKLILKEKKTEINQFSVTLNKFNKNIFQLKKIENLNMIYESKLIEQLQEKFVGATIILFGSYFRGEDTTKSDIDIAIIGSEEKKLNLKEQEVYLERKINVQFYKNTSSIHKTLRENIYNGIVLSGYISI